MFRKILFSLLLISALFLFGSLPVSALQQTAVREELTVIDDLDREVTVSLPLQSVVSLAPSITETLCALGLCDELVAVDIQSNYPEQVAEAQIISGYDGVINYEMILSLEPELVVVAEIIGVDKVKELEGLGLNVFYIKNPTSLDELFPYIEKISKVIGKEDEAAILCADLQERLDAVDEVSAKAETAPLVFYELDATEPSKPWTTTSGTFIDEIITRAGGKNIAADLKGEWIQISLEELIDRNPEIIILGDSNYGVTPETVNERVGWDSIQAVTDGNLFPLDSDIISRPGPRLIDAYELIAVMIHPELYTAE